MNNGTSHDLFQGAFMESGSPDALHESAGQPYYDTLVKYTNCTGQSDTLDCPRQAPYEQLMAAVDMTPSFTNYTSLNSAWHPRLDGDIFVRNPQRQLAMRLDAKVSLNN
ncbi:hypothetical protein AcW1_003154 [Taiwanofungus camphoratus]|nr:hypothetical protein AcW1_003154 [Antrodia cinnamomea]